MKKGFEKFISILLLFLGVILIVFLSLAVFGQLDDATLKNELVRTMILGLAFVFLVCSIVMIAASFKDNDVLKAVVLSSERASTTRVSLSVIKKIVAKNAKYISGLKVSGVALQLDENNAIRMKLTVKISDNDVDFVVDRFRCLLFDAFYAVLGVEFVSIDFKVKALSPKYAPDMNKVDRAAAEIKEKREKLMLQKLKMEEEEARFEEEQKIETDRRRKEEARLRREREEERKRERIDVEKMRETLEDAEEVPVYVVEDDFSMPDEIAESDPAVSLTDRFENSRNDAAKTGALNDPQSARALSDERDGVLESEGATAPEPSTALPETGVKKTVERTVETGAQSSGENAAEDTAESPSKHRENTVGNTVDTPSEHRGNTVGNTAETPSEHRENTVGNTEQTLPVWPRVSAGAPLDPGGAVPTDKKSDAEQNEKEPAERIETLDETDQAEYAENRQIQGDNAPNVDTNGADQDQNAGKDQNEPTGNGSDENKKTEE